ncbi:MAG: hopanoid biosynthesis-associated protein HpnK [Desulfobaccales bacterium]
MIPHTGITFSTPTLADRPKKSVLFTADDFGLSDALNGAVALAHRRGVLGNASLMAAGPRTREAIALARELPGLCLGVHLTLIQGRAVLPPQALPHLVDSQGGFPHDPVATGWRYFAQPQLLPEIRREMAAQIEVILASGLPVWHLNSHVNLHLHPRIFPLVVDLAREYGIPAVRLVREDWRATLALAPDHPLPKIAQGLIFALLCRRAARLARAAGLIFNDHLFGLLNDGRMTPDYLLGLAPKLKPGVTEIYSHPALFADSELKCWAPQYQRQAEFAALIDPRLPDALTAAGVTKTDFRELSLNRAGQRPGPPLTPLSTNP